MDYDILYLCSQSKENMGKYRKYVKPHVVMKETNVILDGMEKYYKTFPAVSEVSWDTFSAFLIAAHMPGVEMLATGPSSNLTLRPFLRALNACQ